MVKRIKVFESGNYPQGVFDKKRVFEIFSKIKDKVNCIFIHSSKWKNENKEPLYMGDFENFELKDNGEKTEVFANLKFNEKGEQYYNDGILKGVSVEITKNDVLEKIAVLPVGTIPAVKGAEFEQGDPVFLLQFEEFKEDIKVTREEVIASLTKEELESVKLDGYDIEIKKHETNNPKTEEQIRAEIKAEFEKEKEIEKEVAEFMNSNVKKITPAMKNIITNNNLKTVFSSTDNIEFEDKNINIKSLIIDLFKSMPDLIKTNATEFENKDVHKEDTIEEIMKKYAEETKKRYL